MIKRFFKIHADVWKSCSSSDKLGIIIGYPLIFWLMLAIALYSRDKK